MREVVAALVYNSQGQLLLGQRANDRNFGGYWEFPGGKIEPGESAFQAIEREWFEEFGIHIIEVEFLKAIEWPEKQIRLHFFRAKCLEPIKLLAAHQRVEWIDPKTIDDYQLLPIDQEFFREYLTH